jgi:MFS family permease
MAASAVEDRGGRGYANYVLAVLFVVYVFNFVDRQVLSILIGPIKEDLGISDTVMGLLAGPAFALFYTLAGIPIARWADRANRITVIALSLTVWSGMTALSGLARSGLTFALARVGVGVGEAGGSPPSHSLISDYFPPERRATALALYANGIYIGSGCAFVFGAWIATQTDWRTVYYVLGLLGIPLALLLRLTVRELPRGASETGTVDVEPVSFREVVRHLFRRRSFVMLVAAASCQSIMGYGMLGWAPEFMLRVHEMSRLDVGLWIGLIVMFAGCLGVGVGGWASDRLGAGDVRWYMRLPAIISIASMPFAFAFLFLPGSGAALAFFAPFYLIANMYVGPLWSLGQSLALPSMRATASALLLLVLNIFGLGGGVFLVGFLNDRFAAATGHLAIRYSLAVVAAIGGASSLFFWLGSATLREDLASRDEPTEIG